MSSRDDLSYIFNDALFDELYDSAPSTRAGSLFPLCNYSHPHVRRTTLSDLLTSRKLWIVYAIVLLVFSMPTLLCIYYSLSYPQPHCDKDYLMFPNNSHCYKIHTETVNYDRANQICQNESAHLTSIHSEEENDFIVGYSRSTLELSRRWNNDQVKVWIGLIHSGGSWQWTDGTRVDFEKWMAREPAYLATDKWTTLSLNIWNERAMQWNNHGNYHENMFVCKKTPEWS